MKTIQILVLSLFIALASLHGETLLSSYFYPERGYYSRSHTAMGFPFAPNSGSYSLESVVARISDTAVPQYNFESVEPYMSAQIVRTSDGWLNHEVVANCNWASFPHEFTDVTFIPDSAVIIEPSYKYAFVITVAHSYGIKWQTMNTTSLPYENTGFSYIAGRIVKYTSQSSFTAISSGTWTLAAKLQGQLLSGFTPDPQPSDPIISHLGTNDPLSEGWTLSQQGTQITTAKIFDDQGSGVDAWSLDDNSIHSGDHHYYRYDFSLLQQRYLFENGWKLTLRIRVADLPTTPDGAEAAENSIAVEIKTGPESRDFDLVIGYDTSDGVTSIITNGIYSWVDDYALVEIEYTPQISGRSKAILTMSINGNRRYNFTGAEPNGSGASYISWGSLGGSTAGQGNWAEVRFEVLPAFVPPEITNFYKNASNQLYFNVTNIKRGTYYMLEKSNDLVNWDFVHGIRPSEHEDIQHTRNIDGDRCFYRYGIK